MSDTNRVRSGLIYGLIAYLCWGLVPLYFAQLIGVDALEILSHRIVWSLPLMIAVLAFSRGGLKRFAATMANRRLVLWLLASSLFLSMNWLFYIYATLTERVAEASLGYYMLPLVNAGLARVFLGERLRPLHYPALAIIAIGVLIPFAAKREFLWIPIALPVTFGIYGLIRKKLPVESAVGLATETALLSVPCLGYLIYRATTGIGLFAIDPRASFWFVFGGVVTVVPLMTFTLSIRRLPLLAQTFIQFVSPTVQVIVAVLILDQTVTWDRWIALGCVLLAVAIFIADAVARTVAKPAPATTPA